VEIFGHVANRTWPHGGCARPLPPRYFMCLAAQLLSRTGADSLLTLSPSRSKDDTSNGSKNGPYVISGGRGASGGARHGARHDRRLDENDGRAAFEATWVAPPIIRFATRNVLRCTSSANGGYVVGVHGRCPWSVSVVGVRT
jgi:hypothetical protein